MKTEHKTYPVLIEKGQLNIIVILYLRTLSGGISAELIATGDQFLKTNWGLVL